VKGLLYKPAQWLPADSGPPDRPRGSGPQAGYSSGEDGSGARARAGAPAGPAARSALGGGAAGRAPGGAAPADGITGGDGGGGSGGGGGGEEARVVEALCAPGGLRAAPAADALRLFVERASGLDGGRVAGLLREQLVRAPSA